MPTIQQPRHPLPQNTTPKTIDERTLLFLKQNKNKKPQSLKEAFIDYIEFNKEDIAKGLNQFQEILSPLFKTFNYICNAIRASEDLSNFIIKLKKLSESPLFQLFQKLDRVHDRLNISQIKKLEAYLKECKNIEGYILSKRIIKKYYLDNPTFEGFIENHRRGYKTNEEFIFFLCTQPTIRQITEKLRKENKKYKNISDIEATTQAFSYFLEKQEKPRYDKRSSLFFNSYQKRNNNICCFIVNPVTTAPFYCCGIYSKSKPIYEKLSEKEISENKQPQIISYEIEINHIKNPVSLYKLYEPFDINPIDCQLWALLLQEINNLVNIKYGYGNLIFKAWKEGYILNEKYRTIKINIGEFIALKNPKNFEKYKSEKTPYIINFCLKFSNLFIGAKYNNRNKIEEFASKIFDSIKLNDLDEIEAVFSDEFIKCNVLTLQSQMGFTIDYFSEANLSNYKYSFNLCMLFLILNRENNNKRREVTIKKIIDWLGLSLETKSKNNNMQRIPKSIYVYLNYLVESLGFKITFDNNKLSTLNNYWNSQKATKDILKQFTEQKCQFSFSDDMELYLKNHQGKDKEYYYNQYLLSKAQKVT